jgi:hypothetical protein
MNLKGFAAKMSNCPAVASVRQRADFMAKIERATARCNQAFLREAFIHAGFQGFIIIFFKIIELISLLDSARN